MRLTIHSMNGSSVPRHCGVLEAGSPSNECPSSEWNFIQTMMSLIHNAIPNGMRKESMILGVGSTCPSAIQLTGKSSIRQYLTISGVLADKQDPEFFDATITMSTTQQAVIADALTSVSALWNIIMTSAQIGKRHGASILDEQKTVHTISNDYYQPYSSAFCVRDAIQGPNDDRIMAFPILGTFDYDAEPGLLSSINANISGLPAVEAPSIRRSQLLELPGMETDNRVKWVQLPESPLTGVSVGLIVLLPQNPSNSTKETTETIQNNTDIVVCNLAAGWGLSEMHVTNTRGGDSATSSLIKLGNLKRLFDRPSHPAMRLNDYQSYTDASVFFGPPMFPSIPVKIDVEWAEYLNPYVPSANTTVMDYLLKFFAPNNSKVEYPEVAIQYMIRYRT